MINRGFITLSFLQALDSLWILEEGGGSKPGKHSLSTGAEIHATVELWPGLLPLARHYSFRKCNNIDSSINVTSLGKDCCLIVDSFEKNYRDKKT